MKRPEIEKLLVEDLSKALAGEQFRHARAARWFERGTPELLHVIKWSCTSSSGGVVVTPDIGVRSAPMLDLYFKAFPLSPADQKVSLVLAFALWRLGGERKRGEFKVTSEAEAHSAAAAIVELVRSDALPWFAKFKSVGDVDTFLNTEPNSRPTQMACLMIYDRAALGLIAARLNKNPRYDELVPFYRGLAAQFSNGQFLPQTDKLIEALSAV